MSDQTQVLPHYVFYVLVLKAYQQYQLSVHIQQMLMTLHWMGSSGILCPR